MCLHGRVDVHILPTYAVRSAAEDRRFIPWSAERPRARVEPGGAAVVGLHGPATLG